MRSPALCMNGPQLNFSGRGIDACVMPIFRYPQIPDAETQEKRGLESRT